MKKVILLLATFLIAFTILDVGISTTINQETIKTIKNWEQQNLITINTQFFTTNQTGQLSNGFWEFNGNQAYHIAMYVMVTCTITIVLLYVNLWKKTKIIADKI